LVGGDLAAGEAGGDREFIFGAFFHALDQLVSAIWLEKRAGVVGLVGLIGDFDQDVGVAFGEEPIGGVVGGFEHRLVGFEAVLLAEIEEADDGGHSQLVGFVENLFDAAQVVGAQ